MKPIGVLVNPAANRGRGNLVGDQVFELLSKAGVSAVSLTSDSAQAAKQKANKYLLQFPNGKRMWFTK